MGAGLSGCLAGVRLLRAGRSAEGFQRRVVVEGGAEGNEFGERPSEGIAQINFQVRYPGCEWDGGLLVNHWIFAGTRYKGMRICVNRLFPENEKFSLFCVYVGTCPVCGSSSGSGAGF